MVLSFKKIAIVGGGLMGYGISQVAATAGHKVYLIDIKKDVLNTAMQKIMQYMMDSKVQKAIARMGEEMSKIEQ